MEGVGGEDVGGVAVGDEFAVGVGEVGDAEAGEEGGLFHELGTEHGLLVVLDVDVEGFVDVFEGFVGRAAEGEGESGFTEDGGAGDGPHFAVQGSGAEEGEILCVGVHQYALGFFGDFPAQ